MPGGLKRGPGGAVMPRAIGGMTGTVPGIKKQDKEK
jgi:hypothetical protein